MRLIRVGWIVGCLLGWFAVWGGANRPLAATAGSSEPVRVLASDSTLPDLLADAGVHGGLVVHVGCGDGQRTAELAGNGPTLVQGLATDAEEFERALRRASEMERDGWLSFKDWNNGPLPYTDNLVNVLFWDRAAGEADREEILRILAPRGVAYVHRPNGWEQLSKAWPEEIAEWTHFRGDSGGSGASNDQRVGPPQHIQWEAGPRVMRSHEIETGVSGLVSAAGRIYYLIDDGPIGITDARFPDKWLLVCRDGFNGVRLWQRELPNWGWQAWKGGQRENVPQTWLGQRTRPGQVDRLMAVEDDVLYVTLGHGAPIRALDGRTGEVLRTYEVTEGVAEFLVHRGVLLARTERPEAVVRAIRAEDGELLWEYEARIILNRSLAASGSQVYLHNRSQALAWDLLTGEELWRTDTDLRPGMLIAHERALLVVQSQQVLALSPEDGSLMWEGPGVPFRGRVPDLFVVGDRVWWGRRQFQARDIRTGEVVQRMDPQKVLESGHHRRCYADKATARYMISGERGSEFLDLEGDQHSRHNWFRGPCIHGMVPANGLFYVPPHQCFCYPAVRMDGFFALAAPRESPAVDGSGEADVRLQPGPAYGEAVGDVDVSAGDWPTYRQNARRGGAVSSAVSEQLEPHWSRALGGRLTQPVVAGDRVFVAQRDAGTLHSLDLQDGRIVWSRTVSGGIDSPPTIVGNLVTFGSRDGHIYCLRARDGQRVWRFRAAPEDRQVVSYDRLESAWPAHGSLLLLDGLLYGTAGRSSFIDGGVYLVALQPQTGELVHQTRLEGPQPDIGQPSYAFHKEGHRADLLTTDGQYVYMGRTVLDTQLEIVPPERIEMTGTQRGDHLEYRLMPGMRLVATGGFLDDTFWNRTWWMHARAWPGFHYAQQAPKSGQLLVFDDRTTYTVKHFTTRNRHSPMHFPGDGILLFADDNDNEPLFYRGEGEPEPIEWEPELPADTRWTIHQDAAVDKGPGFTRAEPPLWTSWLEVRVEAMALAGERLFLAGTPDEVPEDDPLAAVEGRRGGVLAVVCAREGTALAHYPLASRPIFDGLIAAQDRLLWAAEDGSIHCFGAGEAAGQPVATAR